MTKTNKNKQENIEVNKKNSINPVMERAKLQLILGIVSIFVQIIAFIILIILLVSFMTYIKAHHGSTIGNWISIKTAGKIIAIIFMVLLFFINLIIWIAHIALGITQIIQSKENGDQLLLWTGIFFVLIVLPFVGGLCAIVAFILDIVLLCTHK